MNKQIWISGVIALVVLVATAWVLFSAREPSGRIASDSFNEGARDVLPSPVVEQARFESSKKSAPHVGLTVAFELPNGDLARSAKLRGVNVSFEENAWRIESFRDYDANEPGVFVIPSPGSASHILVEGPGVECRLIEWPDRDQVYVVRPLEKVVGDLVMGGPEVQDVRLSILPDDSDGIQVLGLGTNAYAFGDSIDARVAQEKRLRLVDFERDGSLLQSTCMLPRGVWFRVSGWWRSNGNTVSMPGARVQAPGNFRFDLDAVKYIEFQTRPVLGAGVAYFWASGRRAFVVPVSEKGLFSVSREAIEESEWRLFAYGEGWDMPLALEVRASDSASIRNVDVRPRKNAGFLLPESWPAGEVVVLCGLTQDAFEVVQVLPQPEDLWVQKYGRHISFHNVDAKNQRVALQLKGAQACLALWLRPDVNRAIQAPVLREGVLSEVVLRRIGESKIAKDPAVLQQFLEWPDGGSAWVAVGSWAQGPTPETVLSVIENARYRWVTQSGGHTTYIMDMSAVEDVTEVR